MATTNNNGNVKARLWEILLRIVIAAASAAVTAMGTTSCMGYGPISL